ncbi:unnamed protein product [Prunus armeniaca]
MSTLPQQNPTQKSQRLDPIFASNKGTEHILETTPLEPEPAHASAFSRLRAGWAVGGTTRSAIVPVSDPPLPKMKVSEDPYDELGNPDGVIQLGLDENKLSLDLVRDWLVENAEDAILGGGEPGISGIACYQPFDGFMELKVAVAGFMSQVMKNSVFFNPSQIVLTAAIEIAGLSNVSIRCRV